MLYFNWLTIHFLQILNRYFLCILQMHPHFNCDWCSRNYCKSSLSSLYATILNLNFSTDIYEKVQIIKKQYLQKPIISASSMAQWHSQGCHPMTHCISHQYHNRFWIISNKIKHFRHITNIYMYMYIHTHTHTWVRGYLFWVDFIRGIYLVLETAVQFIFNECLKECFFFNQINVLLNGSYVLHKLFIFLQDLLGHCRHHHHGKRAMVFMKQIRNFLFTAIF